MSNKLPTKRDVKFLLAEDVRQEILGKVSLQGLMPGDEFLVGGKPPPGVGANVAFVIPSLAFVFVVTGSGEGKFNGRFKIIAPDKKTIIEIPADKPIEKVAGKATMFMTAAKPFIGPAFGTYTVQLELDKAKFAFAMIIGKGPANARSRRAP